MKITNISSWIVKVPWDNNPGKDEVRAPSQRAFIFVQVDTDEDITGWGEVTMYPGPVSNRAVAAYINIDEPLDIRKGHLHVNDRPGLGINLDPDALRRYETSFKDAASAEYTIPKDLS